MKRSKMVAAFPLSIRVMEEIFLPQLSCEGPTRWNKRFCSKCDRSRMFHEESSSICLSRHSRGTRGIEKGRLPANAKRIVNDSSTKDYTNDDKKVKSTLQARSQAEAGLNSELS